MLWKGYCRVSTKQRNDIICLHNCFDPPGGRLSHVPRVRQPLMSSWLLCNVLSLSCLCLCLCMQGINSLSPIQIQHHQTIERQIYTNATEAVPTSESRTKRVIRLLAKTLKIQIKIKVKSLQRTRSIYIQQLLLGPCVSKRRVPNWKKNVVFTFAKTAHDASWPRQNSNKKNTRFSVRSFSLLPLHRLRSHAFLAARW